MVIGMTTVFTETRLRLLTMKRFSDGEVRTTSSGSRAVRNMFTGAPLSRRVSWSSMSQIQGLQLGEIGAQGLWQGGLALATAKRKRGFPKHYGRMTNCTLLQGLCALPCPPYDVIGTRPS